MKWNIQKSASLGYICRGAFPAMVSYGMTFDADDFAERVVKAHNSNLTKMWYLGAQNDGLFIVDEKPAVNNDYPNHDRKIDMVIKVPDGEGYATFTRAVIDEHNKDVAIEQKDAALGAHDNLIAWVKNRPEKAAAEIVGYRRQLEAIRASADPLQTIVPKIEQPAVPHDDWVLDEEAHAFNIFSRSANTNIGCISKSAYQLIDVVKILVDEHNTGRTDIWEIGGLSGLPGYYVYVPGNGVNRIVAELSLVGDSFVAEIVKRHNEVLFPLKIMNELVPTFEEGAGVKMTLSNYRWVVRRTRISFAESKRTEEVYITSPEGDIGGWMDVRALEHI